ncbi:MAG: LOG family protein [Chloroflexi bacterium]|nr:MAG: LOG family protein [Chloroflexota bacterium]RLT50056.1 MAG: LOG family protein [Chloroflexota bacterium]
MRRRWACDLDLHGKLPESKLVKVISVFGSANPQPGSVAYEQARTLGGLLAGAGFAVSTGGYGGLMSAASQGARENGGHVIGVTCDRIEAYRPGLTMNRWVVEEVRFANLRDRVHYLVAECAAAVALPGGIGTLSEIALTWSLIQTSEVLPKPLLLVGELWAAVMRTFLAGADGLITEKDRVLVDVVPDVEAVVPRLQAQLAAGPAA